MARDVSLEGRPLLDLDLEQPGLGLDRDDPDHAEYVARVEWHKTVSLEDARTFRGIFANPNVVCRLREPSTLDFLHREFGITN